MRLLALALLFCCAPARAALPLSRTYLPPSGKGPTSIGRLSQGLMRVHRGNLQAWSGVTFPGKLRPETLAPLVAALSEEQREELRRLLTAGNDPEAFAALMAKAGKAALEYARIHVTRLVDDERYGRIAEDSLEDFSLFSVSVTDAYGPYLKAHDQGDLLLTLAKLQLRRDAIQERKRRELAASMERYRAALQSGAFFVAQPSAVGGAAMTLPSWPMETPGGRLAPAPSLAKTVAGVRVDFALASGSSPKAMQELVRLSYDMLEKTFTLGWTRGSGPWDVPSSLMLERLKDDLLILAGDGSARRLVRRRHAALLKLMTRTGEINVPPVPVQAFTGLASNAGNGGLKAVEDLTAIGEYYRRLAFDPESLRRIETGDDGKWLSLQAVRDYFARVDGDLKVSTLLARRERWASQAFARSMLVTIAFLLTPLIPGSTIGLTLSLLLAGVVVATGFGILESRWGDQRSRFRKLGGDWAVLSQHVANGGIR
jgi:hypothetical protein